MKRALIVGGNRFIGKKLCSQLLHEGFAVTLFNRGRLDDGFGSRINRLIGDRRNPQEIRSAFAENSWDVVYDQVCFEAQEAREICEMAAGHVGRYVLISSQSIYGNGHLMREHQFDPKSYKFKTDVTSQADYAEAKRQTESVLANSTSLNALLVRLTMVVGEDDYTERLKWHVERVLRNEPMYFPNLDARLGFIHSSQAAQALPLLAESTLCGAVNLAAPGSLSMREFLGMIEDCTGIKARLLQDYSLAHHSPYGIDLDRTMDLTLMNSVLPKLADVHEWLPQLIAALS